MEKIHEQNIDCLENQYVEVEQKIRTLKKVKCSFLYKSKLLKLHEELDSISRLLCSELMEWKNELLLLKQEKTSEKSEVEEVSEDFGNCEECDCKLSYLPNAAWGVGYVCASCARELRGENEY